MRCVWNLHKTGGQLWHENHARLSVEPLRNHVKNVRHWPVLWESAQRGRSPLPHSLTATLSFSNWVRTISFILKSDVNSLWFYLRTGPIVDTPPNSTNGWQVQLWPRTKKEGRGGWWNWHWRLYRQQEVALSRSFLTGPDIIQVRGFIDHLSYCSLLILVKGAYRRELIETKQER